MNTIFILLGEAVLFLLIGLFALIQPAWLMEYFAIQHADGGRRNEFRAVYGGFSIAISGMLVLAILDVALRPGIVFTVVAVVFGMALGRVISFAIDGYFERYAVAFFVLELLLGGALLLLNF